MIGIISSAGFRTMEFTMMRLYLTAIVAVLFIVGAWAEEPGAAPADPTAQSAAVNMQDVAVGDHWTYQVTDEISGKIMETRTVLVTDLSKDGITTRFDVAGTGRSGVISYDRGWNVLSDGAFHYSPNDGTGVRLPIVSETSWKFTTDSQNSNTGQTFKRAGNARVTGKETITTKAGTFETFVIDTKFTSRNVKDPSRGSEIFLTTWYSQNLDHWVRRRSAVRESGHLIRNETIELTDFGRRK